MTYLAKITKSVITSLKNRLITAKGYNVVSATEVAPAGIDCPAIDGTLAVYMETDKKNSPVFIGCVNAGLLAEKGERRIFAVDTSGAELSRIWLYDKVEIGGTGAKGSNVNHAMQYEGANLALTTYFNDLNIAIAAGVASAGGSYTPPSSPFDLSGAKEDTILVP